MSSSIVSRALSGYRKLNRAQKKLFNGDILAQSNARIEIRKHFEQNKNESDQGQIEQMLTMIDEAEDMMLHGILQGKLNEDTGSYGVYR
mmetsp:Transcript_10737/g.10863  ORF Transcript_10737/g.10863 Transcript_10737/m.10863 type:complete len:89 (+) Transcript_10737:28-294(+)